MASPTPRGNPRSRRPPPATPPRTANDGPSAAANGADRPDPPAAPGMLTTEQIAAIEQAVLALPPLTDEQVTGLAELIRALRRRRTIP